MLIFLKMHFITYHLDNITDLDLELGPLLVSWTFSYYQLDLDWMCQFQLPIFPFPFTYVILWHIATHPTNARPLTHQQTAPTRSQLCIFSIAGL